MKWEPGKVYKTVGGYKARIYATDGDPSYPIHGAYKYEKDSAWISTAWTYSGKHIPGGINANDLTTEEWKEPEKTKTYIAWLFNNPNKCSVDLAFFEEDWSGDTGWDRAPWLDPPADWRPGK